MRHLGTAGDPAGHRAARPAGDGGGGTQRHGDDRGRGRVAERVLGPRQVAADDVTGLVGDHADHLIGVGRRHQEAGVEEDALAAGDKGVDPRIVDEVNVDRLGIEAARAEKWRSVGADDIFDLGVADEACVGRGRREGQHRCECRSHETSGNNRQGTFLRE